MSSTAKDLTRSPWTRSTSSGRSVITLAPSYTSGSNTAANVSTPLGPAPAPVFDPLGSRTSQIIAGAPGIADAIRREWAAKGIVVPGNTYQVQPTSAPGYDTLSQQPELPSVAPVQGTSTGWSMDALTAASAFTGPGAEAMPGVPTAVTVGKTGPGAAFDMQNEQGWSTGAKIAVGVGVLALVGGVGYFAWRASKRKG